MDVKGRVVDGATGELLPYASVLSMGEGRGTISNSEGKFVLQAEAEDVLCISFIGYEKRYIRACDVHSVVQLTPWTETMNELTVVAPEHVLLGASRLLQKEFHEHKRERSQYFMRMNTIYTVHEVCEAFITARSMGNLRRPAVVSGLFGTHTDSGLEKPDTYNMNFHHIMATGPWMRDVLFWQKAVTPLAPGITLKELQKHYDIGVQTLQDSTGQTFYLVDVKRCREQRYPDGIVTGQLYLDATTLQVLRFKGRVEDISMTVSSGFILQDCIKLDIAIDVNFDHSLGFTRVSSMAYTMAGGKLFTSGVLFNVDDIDLYTGKHRGVSTEREKAEKVKSPRGRPLEENLVRCIREAGYNGVLWEQSGIVARTDEEERLLKP